jgi:hypothetical protein
MCGALKGLSSVVGLSRNLMRALSPRVSSQVPIKGMAKDARTASWAMLSVVEQAEREASLLQS